jgi:uroporphyrin-III C-methyltransferase
MTHPITQHFGQVIHHDGAPHQRPVTRPGRCTLVGTGPGDPALLTVKAINAIQAATVLFVDDRVSDAVVALASPSARVIHVGKRGGSLSTPQEFIEKLIVMAVREGEQVVRLKAGDPFVFGRGDEEMSQNQHKLMHSAHV